jgi:hypothetical protein
MISQYFTRGHYARLRLAGNVIETHEHAGDFQFRILLSFQIETHAHAGVFKDCSQRAW